MNSFFGTNIGDRILGDDSDNLVIAYSGADVIDAGAGNDTVRAGSGHDTVNAGSGNDVVYAGLGNDVIHGGYGNDTIYGGAGNDIITGSPQDSTRLLGRNEIDTVFGGDGSDTFSILKNAYLSGGDSNYMLIGDFDRSRDRLQLSKGPLYVLETIDNYTRVVLDGIDTVAIIPGLVLDKTSIVGKETYNDFWINASFDWLTFV